MVTNPQVARTHALMLDAARRLLESDGPDAVTHLRVAELAGVSRATAYRHWPDRVDLMVDLLATGVTPPGPQLPADGTARERLTEALSHLSGVMTGEGADFFLLLLARSRWDDRIRAVRDQMTQAAGETLASVVEDGVAKGELPGDLEPELVIDQLAGAVIARRLLRDAPTEPEWIKALVDSVLGQST